MSEVHSLPVTCHSRSQAQQCRQIAAPRAAPLERARSGELARAATASAYPRPRNPSPRIPAPQAAAAPHRALMRSLLPLALASSCGCHSAAAASWDGPRDQWRTEAELGSLPLSAVSRLPNKPPRYQMNQSTIIMPCNNSGYMDPQRTIGWSIIDFVSQCCSVCCLASPV